MRAKLLLAGLTGLLGVVAGARGQAADTPSSAAPEGRTGEAAARVQPVSSAYFVITRRDVRRCASPYCGGYFVARVNHARTTCADGSSARECYVAGVDLSALGLTPGDEAALLSSTAVFRAALTPLPEVPRLGHLTVGAAWRAPAQGSISGTFYRVEDAGIECIAAPCPSIEEEKLNTRQSALIHDIDLEDAPGDDKARALAEAALLRGDLLVDGVHEVIEDAGPAGDAIVLRARQFLLPVRPARPAR